MPNRETISLCGEISKLVDAALGLSILADYDCAAVIVDKNDREIATGATGTAAVILLRTAAELLAELGQHITKVSCSKEAPE